MLVPEGIMRNVLLTLLFVSSAHANVIKADDAALKAAPAAFPFDDWDALTQKYVDDKGRVDYNALKGNAEDSQKLEKVFAAVAATGPKSHPDSYKTKNAQKAFYLDAYNICVWKNVLGRLGPKFNNVDKEKVSFFFFTKFVVDGKEINLKDLEGDVVRPTFKDGRVHMALNCASGGCPMLPRHAFTPAKIDEQLSNEAKKFANEKRNVDYDKATNKVKLSHIFDWYKEDFGKEPAKVIDWINHYRSDAERIAPDAKIEYVDYDWTLNDQHILQR
jgi:hypothetical protein